MLPRRKWRHGVHKLGIVLVSPLTGIHLVVVYFIRTTGDVAKVKTTVLDLYPQLLNTVLTRKGYVKEWDLPYVLPYIMRV